MMTTLRWILCASCAMLVTSSAFAQSTSDAPNFININRDAMPAVAPDGRPVAFQSDRDGGRDVYLLDVRTSAVSRLTRGMDVQERMSWSPDGSTLVFAGAPKGVREVFLVKRDGTGLTPLTRGETGLLP